MKNELMNTLARPLFLTLCLSFASPSLSFGSSDSSSKYDQNFRKNYKKYKSYSPEKKQRIQRLHKSVESLTPAQKRKLRERVMNKDKPNY